MATPRTEYPDDFDERAWQCKVQAEMRCIACDALFGTIVPGTTTMVVLTAHHPNDDPENPDPFVVSLCRACHRRYDRRRKAREKNTSSQ